MARILMTWEFGAGLGHLNRLMPVAERLRGLGHEITLAVPQPRGARHAVELALGRDRPLGATPRVQLVASPYWPGPTDPAARQVPTHTLADVLKLFNYHDMERLTAMVARWDELVTATAAELIVADFCPTLTLALARRVPLVSLGNGYTVPPPGRPLPPIRPWERAPPPFSRAHEAELLRAINRVRSQRGGSSVPCFSDLFSGDVSFICTIPEFDPYAAFRDHPTLIPFNVARMPPGPPAAERPAGQVFVYLPNNHPLLTETLVTLGRLPIQAEVYIKDPPAGLSAPGNVRLHERPLDLKEILPRVRLIIHHAGLATAYAAAMAGTPQLALPLNLEHAITARGLARLAGAGVREALRQTKPEELAQLIGAMLTDTRLHMAAGRAAQNLAARPTTDGVAAVVEGCLGLLARASG
jgi:UDP:flavonoid glycosyltransferase YjiC (YdhE family)